MRGFVVTAVALLLRAGFAASHFVTSPLPPIPPYDENFQTLATSATGSKLTGNAFFTQLLDHIDPARGTFQQHFWWDITHWAGPGSPVVFFTPGEVAAVEYTDYLRNTTITGHFAQELKGAVVLLEHRYYGESSPYDTLTTENLQFLTVKQAIADIVYFARNVDLPFDTNSSSNAPHVPWVFSGGSYSGVLSAWTESVAPGTFWAYQSSSAPVETIEDFWQYFVPIQEGMPQNCSTDVTLVIDYIDTILTKGSAAEKLALKEKFGLETLEHDDDFASALQNGPWSWQDLATFSGYSTFYQFCDAVEGVTAGGPVPDGGGVGLDIALAGYAAWVNETIGSASDACTSYGYEEYDLGCYNTYDPNSTAYTDLTVDNPVSRQWYWILCNEPLNFWQDSAPRSRATIVSRLITPSYWARQCGLYFPYENGYTYSMNISVDNNVHQVNKWSEGWRLEDTTRLIWINGEFDPWRPASMSSDFRPGGPLNSTTQHPVMVIPDGVHCYDSIMQSGLDDPRIQAIIDAETAQIVEWVAEFYAQ